MRYPENSRMQLQQLGLGGAVALTRSVETMLYGVSPSDATSFVFAIILVGGCASIAALLPALRATRIDPLAALRHE